MSIPVGKTGTVAGAMQASGLRRGFTLVELLLGLLVAALVVGALGAFSLAVSASWRHGESSSSSQVSVSQASARIQSLMRSAKLVGMWREGSGETPAAVLIWRSDRNGDGRVQLGEVALIEHDPAASVMYLYAAPPREQMSEQQKQQADLILAGTELQRPDAPERLKEWDLFHPPRPILRQVEQAQFLLHHAGPSDDTSETRRPVLEFAVKMQRDGSTEWERGAAALRGPVEIPE